MNYSFLNILFIFCFFSFAGWCLEVVYRSTRDRKFVNPGLLKGPYLILYGSGSLLLIFCISMFHDSGFFLKILIYFTATTGLEFLSGFVSVFLFKKKLWDYSDQWLNFKGHICPKFSFYWILLALAFEYFIYPLFNNLILRIPYPVQITLGLIVFIIMFIDFLIILKKRFFMAIDNSQSGHEYLKDEFFNIAKKLIDMPEVQKLSAYPHHRHKTRLDHVTEVAWLSFIIGKRFSLDCKAIVRGALLHDLFYYDWLREGPRLHGFRHHNIALKNAGAIINLSPKETDIIKKHMWPLTIIPPRYLESFIVCHVDTFCSFKDYFITSSESDLLKQRT